MMEQKGYYPEIIPAHIDETLPMDMSPEASVMYLAYKKAACIFEKPESHKSENRDVIIAADTIVVFKGSIIGKPAGKDEAFCILSSLRNSRHEVITGVCVFPQKHCFFDKTYVFFKDYSDKELLEYVNTPEPYDKAGGYAIQGTFKKYIHHIEGDFDNVVGFPWYKVKPYL
ncbi:MAG: Maf-like protein [Clostridiales bacterium]|nr:Maf-like protein [Clostridiales bacterium]